MTNKELFQKFSAEQEQYLPFSLQFNWWNEVVVDNWAVAIVANDLQVKAIWPYFIRKKGLWKLISNPHFTPYTGPYILYPESQKPDKKISYENKIYLELIDQLPKFSEFDQKFHLNFINSLAFHWSGFKDEKRFTYLLNLKVDLDNIWLNFRENIRREIRKAEKTLSVKESSDFYLLESLLKDSYSNQKTDYPQFPSEVFQRIKNYIEKYQCGRLLTALDKDGKVHAALFCIWDQESTYYLIGGASAAHKNSGAMSLLIWSAIQASKKNGSTTFNFEGSSIQSIEKYLRGFGGNLNALSYISKANSVSLSTIKKLR